MSFRELQQLARAHAVQPSYVNAMGKRVTASAETLRALLDALGGSVGPHLECGGSTPLSIAKLDGRSKSKAASSRRTPNESVIVLWDGRPKRINPGAAQLRLETGEVMPITNSRLPPCPFGYHRLEVKDQEALVISAPSNNYSDPDLNRDWGVFAPMYALNGDPGFAQWQRLVDWLHPLGAKVVATLPLLAGLVDEPSPYSPASRLFWNEFYVDVDLPPSPGELVDYGGIMQAKRAVLELEAEAFFRNGASKAFNQYRTGKGNLDDYAAFRAAGEKLGCSWQSWPERMRNGELRPGDYDERTKNFYAYVQWRAQQQMDALLRNCASKGMRFYLDLPLGVHPEGYDVWRERGNFALGANAGAPPDAFFTKGQDWGFSPLNPHRFRQTHYRYLIDFLRFQMRHTGLLRIDHVMWLHRLYWIPRGRPASEGAYVEYPAEELYAILCLESHRSKTMLVGENLGTVPAEVNAAMRRHHLRETYVLQYELASPKLRRPPKRSVASLNTHDMPTFEAFLRGLDIDDRSDLGLISKTNLAREHRRRKTLVSRLKLEKALKWLAKAAAEVVLVNIEDLWRETLPQNVPGTSTERPNWRRRLRYSLEQIKSDPEVRRLLKLVADARAQSQPTDSRGRARRKRASVPTLR